MCSVKRKLSFNDVPINYNSRFPEGSLPRNYNGQFQIDTQYVKATMEWQTILLDNDKDKWIKIIELPEPMGFSNEEYQELVKAKPDKQVNTYRMDHYSSTDVIKEEGFEGYNRNTYIDAPHILPKNVSRLMDYCFKLNENIDTCRITWMNRFFYSKPGKDVDLGFIDCMQDYTNCYISIGHVKHSIIFEKSCEPEYRFETCEWVNAKAINIIMDKNTLVLTSPKCDFYRYMVLPKSKDLDNTEQEIININFDVY